MPWYDVAKPADEVTDATTAIWRQKLELKGGLEFFSIQFGIIDLDSKGVSSLILFPRLGW